MEDDETQAHRIKDAQDREDAFVENAIREGDIHRPGAPKHRDDCGEGRDQVHAPTTPTHVDLPAATAPEESTTGDSGHMSYDVMLKEDNLACQVYPEKLVRAICKGIRSELKHNGMLATVYGVCWRSTLRT